jgi:hypothetical protein
MRSFIFISLIFAISAVFLVDPQNSMSAESPVSQCQSGRSAAKLTGWELNSKMPRGSAVFTAESGSLEISVENVALPDGRMLNVLVDDDRIGQIGPLKEGSATGSIAGKLADGDRVRVIDDDRPVVSGNLKCQESETAKNTY